MYFMKKILFLLFLLIGNVSIAQKINTAQISLSDTTKKILYIGISNWIHINNLPLGVEIKMTKATLESHPMERRGFISCRVKETGNATLQIFSEKKLIFTQSYSIKRIAIPNLRLGNYKTGTANIEKIVANPTLNLTFEPNNFIKNDLIRIAEYKITLLNGKKKNPIITKTVTGKNLVGTKLDDEIITQIKNLLTGDIIIIDSIKVMGEDGIQTTANKLKLTIKK